MWGNEVPAVHQGPPAQPRVQYARNSETLAREAELLDKLCTTILAGAEIDKDDIAQKESFRTGIEALCRSVVSEYERQHNGLSNFAEHSVELKCFGSLSSGFATKTSDMDLGLLSPMSHIQPDAPGSPIPRLLEKTFLDAGLGARLLTRTRVPIIKLCETPPAQLLNDLRKEREKWDSGVENEGAGVTEEGDPQHAQVLSVPGGERGSTQNAPGTVGASRPHTKAVAAYWDDTNSLGCRDGQPQPTPGPGDGTTQPSYISLSQAENQSLSAYYTSAKRALRKFGGHDLTASNYRNFTGEDCEILVAVSHAFLSGIRDETLRKRLSAYPSLQARSLLGSQNTRPLLGIYTQVEGEAILMRWEHRTVRERTDELERAVVSAFESWKMIQSKQVSGFDRIHHTKDMQVSLERLKKFPSVQLVLFEQGQFESASHYSDRAAELLSKLIPRHTDPARGSEPQVLERYIFGVCHDDIRANLKDLSRDLAGDFSFRVAARRHKALQLAHELEKALAAGFYPDTAKDTVSHYVDLLRGPMRRVNSTDGHQEWAVPVTEVSTPILATMRHLQDPSTLAPNKPRDTYSDKLEFPKTGAGVQCDINFSAHLALQNTLLLRCYSHTDPRVRPLVLFVKHWAKVRCINTPYRGTLSSYGYVLMALHFLVNVAKPFVCPNLQKLAPPPAAGLSPAQIEATVQCKGRDIRFWRDEQEIVQLARDNRLNQSRDSVGELLRGFFEYYAHGGALSTLPGKGFDWGREVLSLRTAEGLLSKQEKGWTGAKTTTIVQGVTIGPSFPGDAPNSKGPSAASPMEADSLSPGRLTKTPLSGPGSERQTHTPQQKSRDIREVRHRYLLAIEDPFELDHNVARTVTHNGIVSIRDEFRRAWRIIQGAGFGRKDEDLLQPVDGAEKVEDGEAFIRLLADIHATAPHEIKAL